ncbi:MAG: flippase-like domain-containing protein [Bacteroidales bacterium]|nr:flippase-like domain-containing protein [Bacteroidales bacterium]
MRISAKIHKNRTYNFIIRSAIILTTYGFIYKQIFHKRRLDDVISLIGDLMHNPEIYILSAWVISLMIVNWGVESLKWQFLISKIEKVPFRRSFAAVLSGVSVSVFTPNRVGEYFGRVFILEKANPWKGVFITIIGSMSQLLITIIAGSLSFLFYFPLYFSHSNIYSHYLLAGLILLVLFIVVSLVLIFVNVSVLPRIVGRFIKQKFARIYQYFSVISYYTSFELGTVLLLSFLRYCIFALQFYLLLLLFSVEIPLFHGLLLISIVFFVMTAIPTVTLAELGIRGSVSLYFIGNYFIHFGILTDRLNMGIVSAASALWLINLAIPALMGTFFVYRLKFFSKRPRED